MIEVIEHKQDYFRKISSLLEKNSKVKIATFNIYTGVLDDGRYVNDWGGKFFNNVGALFDLMTLKSCDVHVKVGVPRKSTCPLKDLSAFTKDGELIEEECLLGKRDAKWDGRWAETRKRWKRINFEEIGQSHVKLVLISPNHCIFGGRNLSDSGDSDLSFYTADDDMFEELLNIFERLA